MSCIRPAARGKASQGRMLAVTTALCLLAFLAATATASAGESSMESEKDSSSSSTGICDAVENTTVTRAMATVTLDLLVYMPGLHGSTFSAYLGPRLGERICMPASALTFKNSTRNNHPDMFYEFVSMSAQCPENDPKCAVRPFNYLFNEFTKNSHFVYNMYVDEVLIYEDAGSGTNSTAAVCAHIATTPIYASGPQLKLILDFNTSISSAVGWETAASAICISRSHVDVTHINNTRAEVRAACPTYNQSCAVKPFNFLYWQRHSVASLGITNVQLVDISSADASSSSGSDAANNSAAICDAVERANVTRTNTTVTLDILVFLPGLHGSTFEAFFGRRLSERICLPDILTFENSTRNHRAASHYQYVTVSAQCPPHDLSCAVKPFNYLFNEFVKNRYVVANIFIDDVLIYDGASIGDSGSSGSDSSSSMAFCEAVENTNVTRTNNTVTLDILVFTLGLHGSTFEEYYGRRLSDRMCLPGDILTFQNSTRNHRTEHYYQFVTVSAQCPPHDLSCAVKPFNYLFNEFVKNRFLLGSMYIDEVLIYEGAGSGAFTPTAICALVAKTPIYAPGPNLKLILDFNAPNASNWEAAAAAICIPRSHVSVVFIHPTQAEVRAACPTFNESCAVKPFNYLYWQRSKVGQFGITNVQLVDMSGSESMDSGSGDLPQGNCSTVNATPVQVWGPQISLSLDVITSYGFDISKQRELTAWACLPSYHSFDVYYAHPHEALMQSHCPSSNVNCAVRPFNYIWHNRHNLTRFGIRDVRISSPGDSSSSAGMSSSTGSDSSSSIGNCEAVENTVATRNESTVTLDILVWLPGFPGRPFGSAFGRQLANRICIPFDLVRFENSTRNHHTAAQYEYLSMSAVCPPHDPSCAVKPFNYLFNQFVKDDHFVYDIFVDEVLIYKDAGSGAFTPAAICALVAKTPIYAPGPDLKLILDLNSSSTGSWEAAAAAICIPRSHVNIVFVHPTRAEVRAACPTFNVSCAVKPFNYLYWQRSKVGQFGITNVQLVDMSGSESMDSGSGDLPQGNCNAVAATPVQVWGPQISLTLNLTSSYGFDIEKQRELAAFACLPSYHSFDVYYAHSREALMQSHCPSSNVNCAVRPFNYIWHNRHNLTRFGIRDVRISTPGDSSSSAETPSDMTGNSGSDSSSSAAICDAVESTVVSRNMTTVSLDLLVYNYASSFTERFGRRLAERMCIPFGFVKFRPSTRNKHGASYYDFVTMTATCPAHDPNCAVKPFNYLFNEFVKDDHFVYNLYVDEVLIYDTAGNATKPSPAICGDVSRTPIYAPGPHLKLILDFNSSYVGPNGGWEAAAAAICIPLSHVDIVFIHPTQAEVRAACPTYNVSCAVKPFNYAYWLRHKVAPFGITKIQLVDMSGSDSMDSGSGAPSTDCNAVAKTPVYVWGPQLKLALDLTQAFGFDWEMRRKLATYACMSVNHFIAFHENNNAMRAHVISTCPSSNINCAVLAFNFINNNQKDLLPFRIRKVELANTLGDASSTDMSEWTSDDAGSLSPNRCAEVESTTLYLYGSKLKLIMYMSHPYTAAQAAQLRHPIAALMCLYPHDFKIGLMDPWTIEVVSDCPFYDAHCALRPFNWAYGHSSAFKFIGVSYIGLSLAGTDADSSSDASAETCAKVEATPTYTTNPHVALKLWVDSSTAINQAWIHSLAAAICMDPSSMRVRVDGEVRHANTVARGMHPEDDAQPIDLTTIANQHHNGETAQETAKENIDTNVDEFVTEGEEDRDSPEARKRREAWMTRQKSAVAEAQPSLHDDAIKQHAEPPTLLPTVKSAQHRTLTAKERRAQEHRHRMSNIERSSKRFTEEKLVRRGPTEVHRMRNGDDNDNNHRAPNSGRKVLDFHPYTIVEIMADCPTHAASHLHCQVKPFNYAYHLYVGGKTDHFGIEYMSLVHGFGGGSESASEQESESASGPVNTCPLVQKTAPIMRSSVNARAVGTFESKVYFTYSQWMRLLSRAMCVPTYMFSLRLVSTRTVYLPYSSAKREAHATEHESHVEEVVADLETEDFGDIGEKSAKKPTPLGLPFGATGRRVQEISAAGKHSHHARDMHHRVDKVPVKMMRRKPEFTLRGKHTRPRPPTTLKSNAKGTPRDVRPASAPGPNSDEMQKMSPQEQAEFEDSYEIFATAGHQAPDTKHHGAKLATTAAADLDQRVEDDLPGAGLPLAHGETDGKTQEEAETMARAVQEMYYDSGYTGGGRYVVVRKYSIMNLCPTYNRTCLDKPLSFLRGLYNTNPSVLPVDWFSVGLQYFNSGDSSSDVDAGQCAAIRDVILPAVIFENPVLKIRTWGYPWSYSWKATLGETLCLSTYYFTVDSDHDGHRRAEIGTQGADGDVDVANDNEGAFIEDDKKDSTPTATGEAGAAAAGKTQRRGVNAQETPILSTVYVRPRYCNAGQCVVKPFVYVSDYFGRNRRYPGPDSLSIATVEFVYGSAESSDDGGNNVVCSQVRSHPTTVSGDGVHLRIQTSSPISTGAFEVWKDTFALSVCAARAELTITKTTNNDGILVYSRCSNANMCHTVLQSFNYAHDRRWDLNSTLKISVVDILGGNSGRGSNGGNNGAAKDDGNVKIPKAAVISVGIIAAIALIATATFAVFFFVIYSRRRHANDDGDDVEAVEMGPDGRPVRPGEFSDMVQPADLNRYSSEPEGFAPVVKQRQGEPTLQDANVVTGAPSQPPTQFGGRNPLDDERGGYAPQSQHTGGTTPVRNGNWSAHQSPNGDYRVHTQDSTGNSPGGYAAHAQNTGGGGGGGYAAHAQNTGAAGNGRGRGGGHDDPYFRPLPDIPVEGQATAGPTNAPLVTLPSHEARNHGGDVVVGVPTTGSRLERPSDGNTALPGQTRHRDFVFVPGRVAAGESTSSEPRGYQPILVGTLASDTPTHRSPVDVSNAARVVPESGDAIDIDIDDDDTDGVDPVAKMGTEMMRTEEDVTAVDPPGSPYPATDRSATLAREHSNDGSHGSHGSYHDSHGLGHGSHGSGGSPTTSKRRGTSPGATTASVQPTLSVGIINGGSDDDECDVVAEEPEAATPVNHDM